jgi:ADP-ribose pyrophosphatase
MTDKPHILSRGRFLSLARRANWEYATREQATGVVAVVPITDDGKLLLVEQFRPPVGARVLEIPAGLVGDHADHALEVEETAARRELLEETGHEADEWTLLVKGPTSPGICDEVMAVFLARKLRRVGEVMGDGNEEITLHAVALSELHEWLRDAERRGLLVDVKMFSGLHLAARLDERIRGALFRSGR